MKEIQIIINDLIKIANDEGFIQLESVLEYALLDSDLFFEIERELLNNNIDIVFPDDEDKSSFTENNLDERSTQILHLIKFLSKNYKAQTYLFTEKNIRNIIVGNPKSINALKLINSPFFGINPKISRSAIKKSLKTLLNTFIKCVNDNKRIHYQLIEKENRVTKIQHQKKVATNHTKYKLELINQKPININLKNLKVDIVSFKFSKNALKELKLSGIDQLDDFNTFTIRELKLLLGESFEEVAVVLKWYFLPRPIENLDVDNKVVDRFKANGIKDLIDVLGFDRNVLFSLFEDDVILLEEVKNIFKFYEFGSVKKHLHNDKVEEISRKTIKHNNEKDKSTRYETIETHMSFQSEISKKIIFEFELSHAKSEINEFYRYHHEETMFLFESLKDNELKLKDILINAEYIGLNTSYIEYIYCNFTEEKNKLRFAKSPLISIILNILPIYEDLDLSHFFINLKNELNDIKVRNFKDIKQKILNVNLIVFLEYHKVEFFSYLECICNTFQDNLKAELKNLLLSGNFKNKKEKFIFYKRIILDETLAEVGNVLGISRERVRQIVSKILNKNQNINYKRIVLIFEEEVKHLQIDSSIINLDLIKTLENSFEKILFYFLKQNGYIVFKQRNQNFIYKHKLIFNICKKYLESNRNEISIIEIQEKIQKENENFYLNDIINLMSVKFSLINGHFVKVKSKRDRYLFLLKKYFDKGMHIYNNDDLIKLKKLYELEFETKNEDSNKYIQNSISSGGVLIEQGKYIHKDFQKSISNRLYIKLRAYIDEIYLADSLKHVYSVFEIDLNEENIYSKEEFIGIISPFFREEFTFSRSYILKKPYSSFHQVLEHVTKDSKRVCFEELKSKFSFVEEYTFMNFFNSKKNFIPLLNKCYLNLELVKVEPNTLEKLRDFISNNVIKNYISSENIFNYVKRIDSFLLYKYEINNSKTIYDLTKYFFEDQFQFKNSFIGLHNTDIPSKFQQVLNLVKNYDEIDILNWIKRQNDIGIRVSNMTDVLDELDKKYVRVSKYKLVKREFLNLNIEIISQIKEELVFLLRNEKQFKLNELKDFYVFPKLNYKWTVFLLADIIQKYINDIWIVRKPLNYTKIDYYISLSDDLFDLEDLLDYEI